MLHLLTGSLDSLQLTLAHTRGHWDFKSLSTCLGLHHCWAAALWRQVIRPWTKAFVAGDDNDGEIDLILCLEKGEGGNRMRCLDSITFSMALNLSKLPEIVKEREAWHAAVHGFAKSPTWLSNWTTIRRKCYSEHFKEALKIHLCLDFCSSYNFFLLLTSFLKDSFSLWFITGYWK